MLAQFIGYTGTCTQGSTDSWLAGAVTSLPFFVIILILAVTRILLPHAARPRLESIAFAVVAAGSIALLLGNFDLLNTVIIQGSSPCGADFGAAVREDYTIAVIYGLAPLLAAILSIVALRRSRASSQDTIA
jgi:hypothetical protein